MATRIKVAGRAEELVREVQSITGCETAAATVKLVFERYAPHLINWWNTNPHQAPNSIPVPAPVSYEDSMLPPVQQANPATGLEPMGNLL